MARDRNILAARKDKFFFGGTQESIRVADAKLSTSQKLAQAVVL